MTAYHRVYDSRHLQADCKELGSAPEPFCTWVQNANYSATEPPCTMTQYLTMEYGVFFQSNKMKSLILDFYEQLNTHAAHKITLSNQ